MKNSQYMNNISHYVMNKGLFLSIIKAQLLCTSTNKNNNNSNFASCSPVLIILHLKKIKSKIWLNSLVFCWIAPFKIVFKVSFLFYFRIFRHNPFVCICFHSLCPVGLKTTWQKEHQTLFPHIISGSTRN